MVPNICFVFDGTNVFYPLTAEVTMYVGVILSVGGGSLMTSRVTLFGVPRAVAMAAEANQIDAQSLSRVLLQLPCANHNRTRQFN